jgi:hypothetical protein
MANSTWASELVVDAFAGRPSFPKSKSIERPCEFASRIYWLVGKRAPARISRSGVIGWGGMGQVFACPFCFHAAFGFSKTTHALSSSCMILLL